MLGHKISLNVFWNKTLGSIYFLWLWNQSRFRSQTVMGKDRIQLQHNLELNEEFFIYTPSNNN